MSSCCSPGAGKDQYLAPLTPSLSEAVCDRLEIMLVSADDFREPVADARKERFGARPGRAVMSRRRWRMNPYFNSSTVLEALSRLRGEGIFW